MYALTINLNIVQRLGGPVATMLLTLVLTSFMSAGMVQGAEAQRAFFLAFLLLTAMNVVCIGAALRLPRRV